MHDDHMPPPVASDSPFAQLGLGEATLAKLAGLHFDAPTKVQEMVIPAILEGKDVLVRARSGEGKTNAYILPIVERIKPDQPLQAIVLVPARGIAQRLARNLERHTAKDGIRTAILAGRPQAAMAPEEVPHILVATPRRAANYVTTLQDDDFADRIFVVIDELDALLDLGEGQDLEAICDEMPEDLQSLLLTGDINADVEAFVGELQEDGVRFEPEGGASVASRVAHAYYNVAEGERFETLLSICKQTKPRLGLVLANDESEQTEIIDRLRRARVECRALDESGNTSGGRGGDRRGGGGGRRGGGGRGGSGREGSSVIVSASWDGRRLSTVPFSHVIHYAAPGNADDVQQRLAQLDRLNKQGLSILLIEEDQTALTEELGTALGTEVKQLEPLAKPERKPRREERDEPRPPRKSALGGFSLDDAGDGETASAPVEEGPSALPKTLGSRFPIRGGRKRFWKDR